MFLDDKLYEEIMRYSVIPTVDVLFIREKRKVLLGLRSNKPLKGIFYFPGGRIEKGETIKQAVMRKMTEEIGYQIKLDRLMFLNIYDDIFDESIYEGVNLQNITITYIYLLEDNEISSFKPNDSQHNEFRFFEIDDNSLHNRVKLRIRDLLNLNIL